MTNITTIGLDLAKSVFQVHCADRDGQPLCAKSCGALRCLNFSESYRRAWSPWRPVRVRIIGRGHYRISATRYD